MTRLRRVFQILFGVAAIGAVGVALQGRFVLHLGAIRVLSSRNPRNAVIVAGLAALCAWGASTSGERRRALAAMWTSLSRAARGTVGVAGRLPSWVAPGIAACAAVAIVAAGLTRGALVAGGADAYGYVSEAHLLATGAMRIEQPFTRDMTWPLVPESLAPLGYRPAIGGTAIVPIYSSGLPMLMALFERAAGRDAVFYVVPLLGGLAIWMTYVMGARLAGRTTGVAAATLLATSPPFLIQLMVPMSDVAVTAWWATALALLLIEGRVAALVAGLAVGAAILTRPNLVVLAPIPGALLLWRAAREQSVTGLAAQRALLFAAGIVPACLVVAIINTRLYGTPLTSGYAPFEALFAWGNLAPNLARYPRWLLETETPIVLVALLAPWCLARRARGRPNSEQRQSAAVMWLIFVAAVFLSYLFYTPFDGWFWLRFVLPAFPPLLTLVALTLVAIPGRLDRGVRRLATGAAIGVLAWHGIAFTVERGIFNFRPGEQKYAAVGEYIAQRFPERAVFVAMLHSGSIRYYSGRFTVRYDLLPPDQLDAAIEQLRTLGYHPYIVLEEWEEPVFRARFGEYSKLAALDWPPVALLNHLASVKIYDPGNRAAALLKHTPAETIR